MSKIGSFCKTGPDGGKLPLNPDPNGRRVQQNGRTFLEGHVESMATELRDDAQETLGKVGLREPHAAAKAFFAVRISISREVNLPDGTLRYLRVHKEGNAKSRGGLEDWQEVWMIQVLRACATAQHGSY
jgi:hypothetical protein